MNNLKNPYQYISRNIKKHTLCEIHDKVLLLNQIKYSWKIKYSELNKE